jgi:hypothetical protein
MHKLADREEGLRVVLVSFYNTVISNSKFFPEGFTRDRYSSSIPNKACLKLFFGKLQEVKPSDSIIISVKCMYKG